MRTFLIIASCLCFGCNESSLQLTNVDGGSRMDALQMDGMTQTDAIQPMASLVTIVPNVRQRMSTILVADKDVWEQLAQLDVTNGTQEKALIDGRINIASQGDAASFTTVAIAVDGAIHGMATLPPGKNQSVDVDLTANPIEVGRTNTITFQLWGKIAPVVAGSAVNGSWDNVPRSGATVALGLNAGHTNPNWGRAFDGKFNVVIHGKASGVQLYADGKPTFGNTFVVRKSKPTITRTALQNTTLDLGVSADFYQFQATSDPAGSVALKKLVFVFTQAVAQKSFLTFKGFRLRRNGLDINMNEVRITDADGNGYDQLGWGFTSTSPPRLLVVTFVNEDRITGPGNAYTLHATAGGNLSPGDSIAINLHRSGTILPATGFLTDNGKQGLSLIGPHLDLGLVPGGPIAAGSFLWSDLSEIPHSDQSGSMGGSRDWTNDDLLEDLDQVQVLSL